MVDQVPTLADLYQAKRDVKDINTFTHSPNNTFVDGDGITKLTLTGVLAQIRFDFKDPLTFTTGATLNSNIECLRRESDGEYFRWAGPVPPGGKVVAPGTNPLSDPLYVAVGSAALAANLNAGTALIAGVPSSRLAKTVIQVDGIKSLPVSGVVDGQQFSVAGFYVGSTIGGSVMVWDSTRSKVDHTGGTVIAPEAITAWDGTHAGLSALLNWTGSGTGCYVSNIDGSEDKPFTPEIFGALKSPSDSYLSTQKSIDQLSENNSFAAKGRYSHSQTLVFDRIVSCNIDAATANFIAIGNITGAIFDNIINSEINIAGFQGVQESPSSGRPFELKSITGTKINIGRATFFRQQVLVNPEGLNGSSDRMVDGFYYNDVEISNIGRSDGLLPSVGGVLITTTSRTDNPDYSDGTSGRAYVNENNWKLKSIRCLGAGIQFVRGNGQWDPFNGNIFYAPGLESVKGTGIDFDFCNANIVFHPRFEAANAFGNFSEWLIRERNNCNFNIFHMYIANVDRLLIEGVNTRVYAQLTDNQSNPLSTELIRSVANAPVTYNTSRSNMSVAILKNNTKFINGNTTATDVNKPYEKYAGFVKDGEGVVRPYGLLSPYSEQFINSFTEGEVIQINAAAFVRLRGGVSGQAVTLKMSAKRELPGFSFHLEIDCHPAALISIANSAGTVTVQPTAFNPSVDVRGTYLVIYRDFAWRIARISDRLKNA